MIKQKVEYERETKQNVKAETGARTENVENGKIEEKGMTEKWKWIWVANSYIGLSGIEKHL